MRAVKLSTGPKSPVENRRKRGLTNRTAILICGMHRTGTSALTRVLSLLGAALPRNIYPPGTGNELGHWEPRDVVKLHDEMLNAAGHQPDQIVKMLLVPRAHHVENMIAHQ